MENTKGICIKLLLVLVLMAALTAILLPAGAAIVYYKELSARTAYIMIDAIYVLVGLAGGFISGKMMKSRKFLWGIAGGVVYFCCLVLVALAANGGLNQDMPRLAATFVLIVVSAMIGGMMS